jgi:pimeloyl-ACP methyl ester carboxylesterase
MSASQSAGLVSVNGMQLYWERRGTGGTPIIAIHGGFGLASGLEVLLDEVAEHRCVIAVALQGHGHTADIDREFSFESFGDDLAGVVKGLELGKVDLLGYSLGGGAALRATLQHPELIRRQILVAIPFRRDGWLQEVREGMDQLNRSRFPTMEHTSVYQGFREVAPDPDAFLTLMDKTGDLLRRPYDWSDEIRTITTPTMLVFGDADSIPPSHAALFFSLLGGGQKDGGWDGSLPTEMRLAILPGRTHYNLLESPDLPRLVTEFTAS